MSVFLTNDELKTFAENGINGMAIKNTIETYRSQGLADDAIRAKIDDGLKGFYVNDLANHYGVSPEKAESSIDKARASVQERKDNAPSNTLVDNMLTKEALTAGAKGLGVGAERVANAATLGAYDWANDKLGGTSRQRAAQLIQDADEQAKWLGNMGRAGYIASEIGGAGISPVTQALGMLGSGATKTIANPLAREMAAGAITGGTFGGIRSGFDSDFDPRATAKGALIGGAIGGGIHLVKEGVKLGANVVKGAIAKGKTAVDRLTHNALSPSAEEMAAGAQEISGALPDNGELTGSAVKNLSDDIMRGVKEKSTALYDKAEKLAAGRPVVLDKNSHFAKAFDKLSANATKTGRAELNKVWDEVGHSKYDAPSYETAKSYRSWLSEKSATGGTGLTRKQYGDLLEALDKDIEASIGGKAMAAKKAADAFYRNEMSNPDSITNSVNKLVRKDPVSVVGNRSVASAQGKAWKASPLQKVLERGEEIGSPYVADVKQALQANTTTRAQFNRMSPSQKAMVYGDKLPLAEKNFNGGILNWLEKNLIKGVDVATNPIQKGLGALSPISGQIGGTTVSAISSVAPNKNRSVLKALGY